MVQGSNIVWYFNRKTELCGKLLSFVLIKTINEESVLLFILKEAFTHNGSAQYLPKSLLPFDGIMTI